MNSILLTSAILNAAHMGLWYPTGAQLDHMIEKAYEAATISNNDGLIRAVIVPHAGYTYCLKTSLYAYKNIDPDKYDRVFILGPSHHYPINYCTIADATSAETPYGELQFDVDTAQELLNNYHLLFKKLNLIAAEKEHSLEMQFPLIKYIFKDRQVKIVPIMVGSLTYDDIKRVSKAFKKYSDDPRTLFIISSDFCHWGKRFGYQYLPEIPDDSHKKIFQIIEKLDREASQMISSGKPKKFIQYLHKTNNTICGRISILILMKLFKEKSYYEFLSYSMSENITSLNDSSVSYYSAIIRV